MRNLPNGHQTKITRALQPHASETVKEAEWNKNDLQPHSFTRHVERPPAEHSVLQMVRSSLSKTWRARIKHAIHRALRNKATGVDEIFAESVKIDPERANIAICWLREKCMDMKCTVKYCRTAGLVPTYKKGDPNASTSYRPIDLMSHVGKVLKAAIGREV